MIIQENGVAHINKPSSNKGVCFILMRRLHEDGLDNSYDVFHEEMQKMLHGNCRYKNDCPNYKRAMERKNKSIKN